MAADEDFIAQLQRVGANSQCPVCGHANWGISSAPFALVPIDNGRVSIGRGAAVRAVTCENCGFVRLHDPDKLV